MFQIIDNIENLFVSDGMGLIFTLLHLINEIGFETIIYFFQHKFFILNLSGCVDIAPLFSTLKINLLSGRKFFLVVVFISVALDDFSCPEFWIVYLYLHFSKPIFLDFFDWLFLNLFRLIDRNVAWFILLFDSVINVIPKLFLNKVILSFFELIYFILHWKSHFD